MVHNDSRVKLRTYSRKAEILATSQVKILALKIKVYYLCSLCIPCAPVDEKLIDEINITTMQN